jgi:hypothetical protein
MALIAICIILAFVCGFLVFSGAAIIGTVERAQIHYRHARLFRTYGIGVMAMGYILACIDLGVFITCWVGGLR